MNCIYAGNGLKNAFVPRKEDGSAKKTKKQKKAKSRYQKKDSGTFRMLSGT